MLLKLPQFPPFFLNLFSAQMSAEELYNSITINSSNVLLIDVRSQSEYEHDRIPHAISIPLMEIEQGRGIEQIQLMLEQRQLIAYCTIGKRSQKALTHLKQAGISGSNLKGGIQAWHRFVESAQPQPC